MLVFVNIFMTMTRVIPMHGDIGSLSNASKFRIGQGLQDKTIITSHFTSYSLKGRSRK